MGAWPYRAHGTGFSVSEEWGGLGPRLLKEALWCGGKGIDFGIGRPITRNYRLLYE